MMTISFYHISVPFSASYASRPIPLCPTTFKVSSSSFPVVVDNIYSVEGSHVVLCGGAASICRRFCCLKLGILTSLNFLQHNTQCRPATEFKTIKNQDKDQLSYLETTSTHARHASGEGLKINMSNAASSESALSLSQGHALNFPIDGGRTTSLSVAVIGATGELARGKIFPALLALYYSGFLPEDLAIFGFSRKNLTDEDLRSIIASNLTCRIDDHQNCGDKMEAFLSRTYYLDGGNDNREGMSKLNARMEQIKGLESYNNREAFWV